MDPSDTAECVRPASEGFDRFLLDVGEVGGRVLGAISKIAGVDTSQQVFRGVSASALELEVILDEAGAKKNSDFACLREFVAGLRGFGRVGQIAAQIRRRCGVSLPLLLDSGEFCFDRSLNETLKFVSDALEALGVEVRRELGLDLEVSAPIDESPSAGSYSEAARPRFVLEANVQQASVREQRRRIAEMGAKFLAHRKILLRQSAARFFNDPEEMGRFVRDVSDEQEVRFFQTRIHNLLSGYDTYVQGTEAERTDDALPKFRGFVELLLLILECMTELVHFYERHENDIRSELAKNRVAQIVDKRMVLDRILNWALYSVHLGIEQARSISEGMVDRYTIQKRAICRLPDGVSLHARPISLITRVVSHHGTPVDLILGNSRCYAGSILQVLMLVGANAGARELTFEGDESALVDLKLLFEHRLGEGGAGSLPQELSYLGLS